MLPAEDNFRITANILEFQGDCRITLFHNFEIILIRKILDSLSLFRNDWLWHIDPDATGLGEVIQKSSYQSRQFTNRLKLASVDSQTNLSSSNNLMEILTFIVHPSYCIVPLTSIFCRELNHAEI